jgi:F0F1-type ATP synthase delta subunit
MLALDYAQALYRATANKDDAAQERILERFLALVVERNHTKLLPRIAHELGRVQLRRYADDGLLVRLARASDLERFRDGIVRDADLLGARGAKVKTILDDTAIGGYEVRAFGQTVDRTYKRRLINLYETLKRS